MVPSPPSKIDPDIEGEEALMADTLDRQPLDDLFSVVYEELRRLAAIVRRGDGSATPTLTPTALVNEAWLKMAPSPQLGHTSKVHFKRIAARAMRQVLVEAARRRGARKRPGGAALSIVPFDELTDVGAEAGLDVVALDVALRDLARLSPRQAAIVEGRFFGGLEISELAESLNVSPSTVGNDWRMARAWLQAQLRKP
jgi:RNA polymerase sigma factor (TIGR02999 family)